MKRKNEDEKYIRYLWLKKLPVNKKNIYLLKKLVKENKINLYDNS